MTQTLTTERQQFEEWFHEEIVLHISTSNEAVVRLMWKAWQASRELRANREAQPVADGENCWSCGKFFTYGQHSECDGYCPHCNAPVDLEDDEDDEDQLSQVVPVEPTGDMVAKAWREALGKCDHETIKRMYKTMLAAAP